MIMYNIWSIEHNMWWAQSGNGYTPYKLFAGKYSELEAATICDDANKFPDTPSETMVPVR